MRQGMVPSAQQAVHSTSQQNINPNNISSTNQSLAYHMPKKPQFYPASTQQQQHQQQTVNTNNSYLLHHASSADTFQKTHSKPPHQRHDQQHLVGGAGGPPKYHQKPATSGAAKQYMGGQNNLAQIQTQPQSQQYKFQTPTHQHQQQVIRKEKHHHHQNNNNGKGSKHKKKRQKFQLQVNVIEAKLYVKKTMIFQMSVFVKLKMGDKELKSTSQSGQEPKFNEKFLFENIKRKSQIEFSVFHKPFMQSEELIGNAIFIFQDLYPYDFKHVISLYNNGAEVGSLSITLNVAEVKTAAEEAERSQEESDLQQDDVDEELENSIDYRDHEISRQIGHAAAGANKGSRNNRQIAMMGTADDAMAHRRNEYKGLHTQQHQQMQSSTSGIYLNTQVNQPRQSVTESSIIHHGSQTGSSDNSDEVNDSGHKRHNQSRENRHRHHNHHKNNHNSKAHKKPPQQIFTAAIDEDHIVPQQLFYGKGQQHSNSSNNLHMMNGQVHLPNKYQQQQQHSNSQYLYFEELSTHHHHHHGGQRKKSHTKSRKTGEKSHNRKAHHQQQHIMQVDHLLEDLNDQHHQQNDINEIDEELNYGNFLQHRQPGQFGGTALSGAVGMMHNGSNGQNQISTSHSQQMLQGLNKHPMGFDSGGGASGSGGAQQLFSMGNGYNLNPGSNGSQFQGPSYFEDQHSVESLNEAAQEMTNPHLMMHGNTQVMLPYDISQADIQDIEQIKHELKEENERIKIQELRLRMQFDKNQHQLQLLQQEKAEAKKIREQIKQESLRIQSQKEEYEYQRQQMERAYVHLKQEKQKFTQKTVVIDELSKQFTSSIKACKLLQQAQSVVNGDKIEEFINQMKGIQYLLHQMISLQQSNRAHSRAEESKSGNQQNLLLGHIQQESTSSCATNSTGNYNFLLQASSLYLPHQKTHQHPLMMNQQSPIQQSRNVMQPSKSKLGMQNTSSLVQNRSRGGLGPQESPKVITDIINTEEDEVIEGLIGHQQMSDSQNEMFKRLSPPVNDDDLYDFDNPLKLSASKTNKGGALGMLRGIPGSKQGNHFLNEQHELSTIIERELTSQRRSSNDGLGPNTTVEGRGQKHQVNLNDVGGQFIPQASAFQMAPGIAANDLNDFDDLGRYQPLNKKQANDQSNVLIENQAYEKQIDAINKEKILLQEEKKLYEDKKLEIDSLYQKVYQEFQDIQLLKQGMLNNISPQHFMIQQQQMQSQFMNQYFNTVDTEGSVEEEKRADIVHITASDMKSNSSVKHLIQNSQKPQNQTVSGFQPSQGTNELMNLEEEEQESSLIFEPNPDFLKQINQNMQCNDKYFGPSGQPVSNNEPQVLPSQQQFTQQQNNFNMAIGQFNQVYQQQLYPNGQYYDEEDYEDQRNNGLGGPEEEMMSQGDYHQMFGNQILAGNIAAVGGVVPGSGYIDHEMNIHENVQQNNSQGQGDRKIEYIQDDFEEIDVVGDHHQEEYKNQNYDQEDGQQNDYEDEDDGIDKYGTIKRDDGHHASSSNLQSIEGGPSSSAISNQGAVSASTKKIDDQKMIQLMIKGKHGKLSEDEYQKLIDQNYLYDDSNKDHSVIYYNGKVYDQKKKAIYGIQRRDNNF